MRERVEGELNEGMPVVKGCEAAAELASPTKEWCAAVLQSPAGLCKLDGAQIALHALPSGSQCELHRSFIANRDRRLRGAHGTTPGCC